jgi:hypothetical protein
MSTINYTYNVIVDRFRQFAAGHFQLRRFTHGEISQADLEKEAEWPWLHVKPRAINYSPGTRSFQFEIFISDLPRDKEDKTGYQAESITDCSLIFQDLINEIYLGNMFGSDVVLTRPVNAEPFVEQYTHTLTGVTGTIELSLDYDWSACSIPASWNYNTPTDSGSDGWGALQFIDSLDQNGVYVSLLNDIEAPGNSYYYGTDAEGVKGWHAIVDNIGLTCETLPECATIIGITEDIIYLLDTIALKANTSDLGATAFSNDYNDLDNLPSIPSIAGLATVTYVDQQDALKVDKVAGKGLSTEDYTTAEKSKLAGIEAGAEVNVNADWNAVSGDAQILNKPSIPAAQVNSDWNATSGVAQILNKPTLTNGTVTAVTATAPMSSTGGATPNLSMSSANGTTNGYLSATDWATFNAKQNALGYTPVPETRTLTINGTTQDLSANRTFTIASNPGTVTSVAALTLGTTGTDLSSTVANGTSTPVITLNVPTASATNRGALSSADWTTFNGKQAALVSGTNIKTINGTSVLGSGDLAVSGSNIYNADGSLTAARTLTLNTFALTILGTTSSRFFANGNFAIGTTTDAGFKLDVNGTARVSGLTTTTINASGNIIITANSGGGVYSGFFQQNGQPFIFNSPSVYGTQSGAVASASGLRSSYLDALTWAQSSGTAEFASFRATPTINQTGTATGITRGLHINPTLTAAADWRAIEVASGITILGASTTAKASLRIPSGTAPTSPVNGDIWFDGTNIKMQIGGVTKTFTLT